MHPKQQKEEEEEEQEEEEENQPGQRPCANPGHGPVPTFVEQLVNNWPQDEDHLEQERHPQQKKEMLPGQSTAADMLRYSCCVLPGR